tara:strand:- start:23 stop:574 length:552 start_codon:yes stop_codon:yes gene_type:complete
MKIPARMIRSVIPCQAKNDGRYYLNGFNVTSKFIQSTNGHVAVQLTHGIKGLKRGIYNIKSKIPKKCETVEFVLKKNTNIVKFIDFYGELIGVSMVEVIKGKFPDINTRVVSEIIKKPINNNVTPMINAKYLALTERVFAGSIHTSVELEFRGGDTGVIVKCYDENYNDSHGSPLMIIMPVRR